MSDALGSVDQKQPLVYACVGKQKSSQAGEAGTSLGTALVANVLPYSFISAVEVRTVVGFEPSTLLDLTPKCAKGPRVTARLRDLLVSGR